MAPKGPTSWPLSSTVGPHALHPAADTLTISIIIAIIIALVIAIVIAIIIAILLATSNNNKQIAITILRQY